MSGCEAHHLQGCDQIARGKSNSLLLLMLVLQFGNRKNLLECQMRKHSTINHLHLFLMFLVYDIKEAMRTALLMMLFTSAPFWGTAV